MYYALMHAGITICHHLLHPFPSNVVSAALIFLNSPFVFFILFFTTSYHLFCMFSSRYVHQHVQFKCFTDSAIFILSSNMIKPWQALLLSLSSFWNFSQLSPDFLFSYNDFLAIILQFAGKSAFLLTLVFFSLYS